MGKVINFMKLMRILAVPAFLIITKNARAQDDVKYNFDEIVVTASRTPTSFSNSTRSVQVIRRSEIEKAPVQNVHDLLNYAIGVDLMQRGPGGVQADISIRGATFEQTLILLDGIKINDPQTGHHSLNLPISLEDVERIEILKGQGSRLYGPDAFGGVITIISRKDFNREIPAKFGTGEFGYLYGDFTAAFPFAHSGHRLSISSKKSDGYRENTEFDIQTFNYNAALQTRLGDFYYTAGHTDKKFGANSFYSDLFPNEWEHTQASFMNARAELKHKQMSFSPNIFWRRHKDDFVLDRDRPDWYRNRHTTEIYGAEFQSTILTPIGAISLGGEIGVEEIQSSSLGDHSRTKAGIVLEQFLNPLPRLTLVLGGSVFHYSSWGWQICPGIDFSLRMNSDLTAFASVGKAFRAPTYTELYYQSPANQGNSGLLPEKSWSFETGLRWLKPNFSTSASVFHRRGTDLIDWVRSAPNALWIAQNFTRVNTNGFELAAHLSKLSFLKQLYLSRIGVSYVYLDADQKATELESKFVLKYLRHQLLFHLEYPLGSKVSQQWKLRLEDRVGADKHFLVDTKIALRLRWLDFYADAANLFNVNYVDIGSIPMPGRWIRTGVSVRIGNFFTKSK